MKRSFLSKHFPVPKYLKPLYLGVSFSESNIKAVSFDKSEKLPKIKSIVVPLEKGAIIEGKIINQEEIVNKLTQIKKDMGLDFVYFTIPDELTYIFSTKIPFVHGMNLEEAVAFTIEENIPITMQDSVFDYVPYNIEEGENGLSISVVVSACTEPELNNYVDCLNKSEFEVLGSVNESQAIADALIKKNSNDTFFIVHARKERIGTYLVKGGIVHFSTVTTVSKGDYQEQFLSEYEKFVEYSAKYSLKLEDPIKAVFVCGEFEYARKIIESTEKSPEVISNLKLSNVWTNVIEIEKDLPNIKYEESLNLAGPIGLILNN